MKFSEQLLNLMNDLRLTQTQVSNLTGVGKSSISQYLSGKNEPSAERKKQIAVALGVDENYFEHIVTPKAKLVPGKGVRIYPESAAKLLGKTADFVRQGLQDRVFPWGYAVKFEKKWSYCILAGKFSEYTGIVVPEEMLV